MTPYKYAGDFHSMNCHSREYRTYFLIRSWTSAISAMVCNTTRLPSASCLPSCRSSWSVSVTPLPTGRVFASPSNLPESNSLGFPLPLLFFFPSFTILLVLSALVLLNTLKILHISVNPNGEDGVNRAWTASPKIFALATSFLRCRNSSTVGY